MSLLYFIRHGQASFGRENYDKLSERGRRQCALLCRHFDAQGVRFDVIYTGTLARHRETADALLPVLAGTHIGEMPVRHEGLDEYPTEAIFRALAPEAIRQDPSLGDEIPRLMEDRRSFQRVFEAVMALWAAGTHDMPGISTWDEFSARVNDAIGDIMKKHGSGKNIAICTSGGPISVAVGSVLGLSAGATMRVVEQLVNSSVSRFKCTESRIMMYTFNEFSHLEGEKDPSLITYR